MALVPTCGRRPRGAECRGGGGGGGGGGREGPDLLVDLHGFLVLLQLGRVRGHLQQTLVGRATGRWSRGGGHGAASPLPPQHRGSPRSPETPAPPQHNPRRGQERAARMRRAASSGEKTPGGGSGFGDGPPAAEPGRGADPARSRHGGRAEPLPVGLFALVVIGRLLVVGDGLGGRKTGQKI